MLGIWVGPDWHLANLIPWELGLIDHLAPNPKTSYLLVILMRELQDGAFAVLFQEMYEGIVPAETLSRYWIVIDGAVLDRSRGTYLTDILGRELLGELRRRIANRIAQQSGG